LKLDTTQIAIRERSALESFDLALHVIYKHRSQIAITMAIGVIPAMILNHLLIGWMAGEIPEDGFPFRFLWTLSLLTFLEAQLVSVFTTAYLGQAVFADSVSVKQVVRDVYQASGRLFLCQGLLRGPVLIWFAFLLMLLLSPSREYNGIVEVVLLGGLVFISGIVRAFRPFMNEIILLEKNPLRSQDPRSLTISRRSRHLHSRASGELFGIWIGGSILACFLSFAVYGLFLFWFGIFGNNWDQGLFLTHLCFPLSLWFVVSYFTVVRFLNYLNLRIRQEGWEIELVMRAEAQKREERLT